MLRTSTGHQRCHSQLLECVPFAGRQSALPASSLHQLRFHQRTLVMFVHLADDKLRVTPDNELLDPKFCRDPETGKQTFVLCSIVGCLLLGEVHLDYVLEMLSGGRDKQRASTGALQREGTIKIHQPLFACFFDGDARLWDLFIWCRCPLCYELRQCSALDS